METHRHKLGIQITWSVTWSTLLKKANVHVLCRLVLALGQHASRLKHARLQAGAKPGTNAHAIVHASCEDGCSWTASTWAHGQLPHAPWACSSSTSTTAGARGTSECATRSANSCRAGLCV